MKLLKKIAAIMLSIMMVLGMASVVSADTTTSGTSTATKGKITIDNAIVGQTYKIYQILELESFSGKPSSGTNTGNYAYKVVSGWSDFITTGGEGNAYLESTDGYVKWKGETDDASVAKFAKKALAYAVEHPSSIKAITPTSGVGTTNVIFENLNLGYYLVDSSAGALCSLNTTDTDVTIREKNNVPSVKKKVQEDSTSTWGDSNTADIGQTVNFKTTITAQPGAQNYVLHDKMDKGLTFDGTVTVKKNKADVAETNYTLKKSTDSSVTITDDCTFEIAFTQEFCDKLAKDDQIIVTYSATLNENAVIAGDGNKNDTWLKYGENSNTTHSETTTKTYSIPVLKYTMKNNTETALAGATFTLSKSNDGSNPIELVSVGNDIYRVAKTGDADTVKVAAVTTSASGKFTIKGLDADTYYLTETQQPDGYNKLSASIKVAIAEDESITVNDQASSVPVKVENNTGSILPSTGGSGTTLIYILGAVLVLGSSVVLITKKRMR